MAAAGPRGKGESAAAVSEPERRIQAAMLAGACRRREVERVGFERGEALYVSLPDAG